MRHRWKDRNSFRIRFSSVIKRPQKWKMLEKEKAAEKAEVKGGIHGRLEKAKAEIKAKEADKVPKNKSKDLAAAL